MQFEIENKTIRDLVGLHKAEILKANPEYQRGVVWSVVQKQKLIDSVFRGYPLPLIYLHYVSKTIAGMKNEGFEIIDGQQRIRSLYEFAEGAFKLLDPAGDAKKGKFPAFIKNHESPWAKHDIHSLSLELREKFLDTPLAIAKIQSDDQNEIRDLFVRLQSGLPLNHQETRDAWPGEFTEFILRIGGKPELPRYPGHPFFSNILRMKARTDRGKTRQLAAQLAVLVFERSKSGRIVDIDANSLNDHYYENLGFNAASDAAVRFVKLLDKAEEIFRGWKGPKLRGHDAIHLILLMDSLWDDYAPNWHDDLPRALTSFLANLAEDKLKRDDDPGPYWIKYGQLTRASSDAGKTIARRHQFYSEEMKKLLPNLKQRDPKRLFGELDRTILFFRQNGVCPVCEGSMNWDDCEVHHVEQHSDGGQTTLENGAAVHPKCHPKGQEATARFAGEFRAQMN